MKIATLARLRGIYQGLTLAQRAQLMAIVQCDYRQLTMPVCESLAALELVRLDGDKYWDKYWDKYVATEEGRYVASLF